MSPGQLCVVAPVLVLVLAFLLSGGFLAGHLLASWLVFVKKKQCALLEIELVKVRVLPLW